MPIGSILLIGNLNIKALSKILVKVAELKIYFIFSEEDAYSTYSKVMYKYFIAEGVVNNHSVFVATQEASPAQTIADLPAVEEETQKPVQNPLKDEEMKIAWRYQNMKIFDSGPKESSVFGHYYDLTKRMSKDSLDKANLELWDGEDIKCQHSIFENSCYMDLLLRVEKAITGGQFLVSQTPDKRNILRIAIQSLGSRLWLSDSEDKTQKDLLKFLYMLRALLRESFTVAMITVPTLNFDDSVSVLLL